MSEKILQRDPIEEMKKAFKLFDDDDTGKINLKNLRRVFILLFYLLFTIYYLLFLNLLNEIGCKRIRGRND